MFRPHHRICYAAFLLDLSVMMGITAMPFLVRDRLGGDEAMSGTFGAAQAIAYAVICLVSTGFVSRSKNGLNWATAGLIVYTAFYWVMPFTTSPLLCGASFALSVGMLALVWPALHAWVGAEPDPTVRARLMGRLNVAWSSGFAAGPLFAGPLYDADYRLPFVLMFGLAIIALILVRTLPHEDHHFEPATEELLNSRVDHDRTSEAYLYVAWSGVVMVSAFTSVTRSVYPVPFADMVDSGQLRFLFEETPAAILTRDAATKFSWISFAMALATMLAFLAMGRTTWWRHRLSVLFLVQAASAGAFWVLGSTRSLVVMMGCVMVIGSAWGVAFFSSLYYSLADPKRKHRRAAINESVIGIGSFAGSLACGWLASRYTLSLPFHWAPVVVLFAMGVQVFLLRHALHSNVGRTGARSSSRST